MKKVLITGKGSYIGTSFIQWVNEKHPGEFEIEELDMIDVTCQMVKMIGKVSGHKIRLVRGLNLGVIIAGKIPGKISVLVNKAFGNMVYEKGMSEYKKDYRVRTLYESIKLTEDTK